MKEGGDKREGEVLSFEDSKGWGLSYQWWLLSLWIIHQSSVLRVGSFCVWYIWSGTAAHDWATNVRTWIHLLVKPPQSSFLLPYSGGLRLFWFPEEGGVLISLGHMHTHTHSKQKPNYRQVIWNLLDIHSWNCFSFLSTIPGFLLERFLYQEVFPFTLMSIFRLSFTPGLVLILDSFIPDIFGWNMWGIGGWQ